MRITAKVIKDTLHPWSGPRLTTMELEYPRFIHGEFMTHRVFSRNASSSRAIPVERMVKMALEDPAFFVHLGSNKPGMQAGAEIPQADKMKFLEEWIELGQIVASYVSRWSQELGLHKQVVNRALEPWHHIKVVVTSTRWHNFFSLRDHPDAQPEMRRLAQVMIEALAKSVPTKNHSHRPYLEIGDMESIRAYAKSERRSEDKVADQVSAARCARVSYWNQDGSPPNVQKDLELFDRLCKSEPKHLSPLEHVCWAATGGGSSNLGPMWAQLRSEHESRDALS